MEIYNVANRKPIDNQRKIAKKNNSISNFSNFLSSDSISIESSNAPEATETINNINPFLFLQELPEQSNNPISFFQQSKQVINYLEEIRYGLLGDNFTQEQLDSLITTLEFYQFDQQPPEIQELFEEIHLRALVEVEKLKKSAKK